MRTRHIDSGPMHIHKITPQPLMIDETGQKSLMGVLDDLRIVPQSPIINIVRVIRFSQSLELRIIPSEDSHAKAGRRGASPHSMRKGCAVA